MPASNERCDWFRERIEPYVDGELPSEEVESFEKHAESCASCREELSWATAVVTELRALPQQRCPQRVVDAATAETQTSRPGAGGFRRLLDLVRGPSVNAMRPAMAAMLVIIVAVSVFVLSRHEQSPFNDRNEVAVDSTLSERDLELAKLDAMVAFAYLGKYSQRTGEIIKRDVFENRVMKPVGRTVVDPIYPFPRDE
jgi:anti-sigma factor RsiW